MPRHTSACMNDVKSVDYLSLILMHLGEHILRMRGIFPFYLFRASWTLAINLSALYR